MIYPLDLFLRTLAQLHHRHNRSQIQFVSINEYCSISISLKNSANRRLPILAALLLKIEQLLLMELRHLVAESGRLKTVEQAMNKVGHQQCHHNRKQNATDTVESAVNQITTRSQILAEQDSKCC